MGRIRVGLLITVLIGCGSSTAPVRLAEAAPPLCSGATATIVGTEGDDVLTGTPGPDVIAGLGGCGQYKRPLMATTSSAAGRESAKSPAVQGQTIYSSARIRRSGT
jgi:hypothetical protein